MGTRRSAQLCRPRGSTQPLPSEHSRVQYPCSDGQAVIKARGIAHIPGVASREGRVLAPSEKGPQQRMSPDSWSTNRRIYKKLAEGKEAQTQLGWDRRPIPQQGWDQQLLLMQTRKLTQYGHQWQERNKAVTWERSSEAERWAVSPRQPDKGQAVKQNEKE